MKKILINFYLLICLCVTHSTLAMVSPEKSIGDKISQAPSPKGKHLSEIGFDASRASPDKIKDWFLKFGKNHNNSIVNTDCIQVNQVALGGLTAEKVFLITSSCDAARKRLEPRLLYALKVYKATPESKKEVENLMTLKSRLNWRHPSPSWPRIVFPEYFFKFSGPDMEGASVVRRYATLIHAARGKTLQDWFRQYKETVVTIKTQRNLPLKEVRALRKKQEYARRQILMAAEKLGQGLALMHAKYLRGTGGGKCLVDNKMSFMRCTTLCHGDPNMRNIFWDDKSKRIYLIDIESMAQEQKTGCMTEDISVVIGTVYTMSESQRSIGKFPELNGLIQSFLHKFIDAYIKTYRKKTPAYHAGPLFNFYEKIGWGFITIKTNIRDDTHPHAYKFWNVIKSKFTDL